MHTIVRRACLALLVGAFTIESAFAQTPDYERYMLLGFVESETGAKLTVGEIDKHPEPLFGEDKPWEVRFDNVYATVVFDQGVYKCWYNPFTVDMRTTSTPEAERNPTDTDYMRKRPNDRVISLLYATSADGLVWEKPDLNLLEFEGNTANNFVMHEPHGVGIFVDPHDADPKKRYKAFFSSFDFRGTKDMTIAYSPDGVNWSDWVNAATIESPGDTHNNAFWDERTRRYMGYTREKGPQGRVVTFTESKDFLTWTKHTEVFAASEDPLEQAHDMIVFPTGGIYIGLLGSMHFPEGATPDQAVMDNVTQHVELTWSPDGTTWHRIEPGTPFIPNGTSGPTPPEFGKMAHDFGVIFASAPVFLEDEVRIYYGAGDWYFFDWRKGFLGLATIKPDHWAGYEPASDAPAEVNTVPVVCRGSNLEVTANIEAGGSVKVTLLDANGAVIAESEPMTASGVDSGLTWMNDYNYDRCVGHETRIRFEITGDAQVYSFAFGDQPPPRGGEPGPDMMMGADAGSAMDSTDPPNGTEQMESDPIDAGGTQDGDASTRVSNTDQESGCDCSVPGQRSNFGGFPAALLLPGAAAASIAGGRQVRLDRPGPASSLV